MSTTVGSGGLETVYAGGTASGTTLGNGGGQLVFGAASGTTVNSGGTEADYGTASGTTVNSGGNEKDYGTTVSTTVGSGGLETVEAGGSASGNDAWQWRWPAGVRDGEWHDDQQRRHRDGLRHDDQRHGQGRRS